MNTNTLMGIGLLFCFSGDAYRQVSAWQMSVNQEILRHQVVTRGHALVLTSSGKPVRITRVPSLGEYQPYYGKLAAAYRYSFHPLDSESASGCELQVTNLMAGFAYFYPRPIQPLHMHLPNPPEILIPGSQDVLDSMPRASTVRNTGKLGKREMRFLIPKGPYHTLVSWPWYGRALSSYLYTFTPMVNYCQVRVRLCSGDAYIDLVPEESL